MENFDLLILNGEVFTDNGLQHIDIGTRNGRISALAPSLPRHARDVIDATGMLVLPGIVDAHTHMGIPIMDTFSADDFGSGSTAAACGGVTTVFDFTVHGRGESLRKSLARRMMWAEGKSHVDYAFHVNVTDDPQRALAEIPRLIAEGFPSYKTFSTYQMKIDPPDFRRVLKEVSSCGGTLLLHAEDDELVAAMTRRHVESGRFEPICHARSRPAEAEARAIATAAKIAKELGAPLYIVHLSSKVGLEAARSARREGAVLYLETCPQYLFLDEECYHRQNGHYFITTPPLRTKDDSEALWDALSKGEIDVVATDHCSFTAEQKERGQGKFHLTPNGLPGVETLLPLMYSGVARGRIGLQRLVQLLAQNPARIFGIADRKGHIRPGADADFALWDPHAAYTHKSHGKADWTPYADVAIAGGLAYTIMRGQVLVKGGEFTGKAAAGKLLTRCGHKDKS